MKPLPIPPGTYPLDSPEVAKLLKLTPEKQQQFCEGVHRATTAFVRKQLHQYDWDGAGI